MSRSIIYIVNPVSGTKDKKDLRGLIEEKSKEKNIPFEIFPSVASGDYSFLLPIIEEKKITDVVIAGGDGTINQVISSLMKTTVNFGIIPCGSGNGLALTAKIPRNYSKALDIIYTGRAEAVDGFSVNNQFSCMLCGLGFDAKVAHDFAAQPTRGLMTYVKQTVKNFISARTYSFEIVNEKQNFPVEAYFISIANSNQFGNNFTIAPSASISDGLLDIVIVTKQSKISMLIQTLKQVRGKNKLEKNSGFAEKKGVIYFQTEKLTIKNISKAPFHIDGDPAATSKTLDIRVRKKCFRLIQPLKNLPSIAG
jgi:YegS/Rv2252/BmrU family lipid kinase